MIIEQNDVKLISIKTKSLEDLDNLTNDESNLENSKNSFKYPDNKKSNDNHSQFSENIDEDHFESSVRILIIDKSPSGTCGFHLTRSKWDPYPWVSAVDKFTPAEQSGVQAGDCVLEVNGCDVLGLRITEIAKLVNSSQHQVTLLLWSTKCNTNCDEESLCAAPMPRSLQRLSLVVQTVLSLIECPVCLDTITPPAMQCQNGHLLCVDCRIRAEKCPVCRDRYFPGPALIAEQIQSAITSAFNLCRNEDKVRQKIFGRHNRQRQMVKTTLESLQNERQKNRDKVHKSSTTDSEIIQNTTTDTTRQTTTLGQTTSKTTTINGVCDRIVPEETSGKRRNPTKKACNKFFTKLLNSKAYSVENLTNGHNNATSTPTGNGNNTTTTLTSAISQPQLFVVPQQQQCSVVAKDDDDGQKTKEIYEEHYQISNTNQFKDFHTTVDKQHLLPYKPIFTAGTENDLNINSNPCCKQMLNNNLKHYSISTNDLTRTAYNVTCLLESSKSCLMSTARRPCPSVCETEYQTIPRALKVKNITSTLCSSCQSDNISQTPTLTNSTASLKSQSSSSCASTTSLNSTPNLCLTLSLSSAAQKCQSLLSSSSSTPAAAASAWQ